MKLARLLTGIIVVLSLIRIASTYRVFSQTADEDVHIAAGYQWLTKHAYDVDAEHPPLARMFFAIDAVLTSPPILREKYGWEQGKEILYRNDNYRTNVARARAGNLVFFLIAFFVTLAWARHLWGIWTGLAAAALLATSPSILGHAGLATTDMAATAGTTVALYALSRWLEKPGWRETAFLALGVALGLTTKFSFLIFFPMGALGLVAPLFAARSAPAAYARRFGQIVVVALFAVLSIWASYWFAVGKIRDARIVAFPPQWPHYIAAQYATNPGYEWMRADLLTRFYKFANRERDEREKIVDIVDWAKAAGYPSPAAGRRGNTLEGTKPLPPVSVKDRVLEPFRAAYQWVVAKVPVPAPMFVAGAELVRDHASFGHISYLFGKRGYRGWWYYFPVIIFFKSTIPFFVLTIAGLILCLRSNRTAGVALAPLLMLLPPMASSINIGVRHVLPLFPLFAICAAHALVKMWNWRRPLAIALLAWHLVAGAVAHPDYLAYFNEVAGRHPERIALDSNLDWGQDLNRLVDRVRREKIPFVFIAYFGKADWRRHYIRGDDLPPNVPVHGWVAISEMKYALFGADGRGHGYEWLRGRPYRRVGKSIRLYYIP